MSTTPQWKLRRLAPRALAAVARHAPNAPAVQAVAEGTKAAANTFIAAYDKAARHDSVLTKETAEGKSAIAALSRTARAWTTVYTAKVPSADAHLYLSANDVADDVMTAAEHLLHDIDDHRDAAGQPLDFAASAHAQLDPAINLAHKEVAEAVAADADHQVLLTASRDAATNLDHELVTLRRVLATVLGRANTDYERLRARLASHTFDGDPPDLPTPPKEPVAPKT